MRWKSFHLVPASKQSTNLYDIYLMLCVQLELLVMEGTTVRNRRARAGTKWKEFHILPASKQSTNLYGLYLMQYVQS